MDYNLLKKQLLKAIRAPWSQNHLSQKLNYSYNQVHKWEADRKKIFWSDFIKICNVSKINLYRALDITLGFQNKSCNAQEILNHVIGNIIRRTQEEFANFIDIPCSKIGRWVRNETDPTLEDMLYIIDECCINFPEFIGMICDIEKISTVKDQYHQRMKIRNLFYKYPWVAAAKSCLALKEYKDLKKHRPGFIAKRIGISQEAEKFIIELLEKHQLIFRKDGKYVSNDKLKIDLRTDFKRFIDCLKFWLNQSINYLEDNNDKIPNEFSYFVFNISDQGYDKIKKIIASTSTQICQVVMEDVKNQDNKNIILTQCHSLNLTNIKI